MIRNAIMPGFLTFLIASNIYASDVQTWIGPFEVLSERFTQYGGPLGYKNSLDRGDCCCGGPETEDLYPHQIRVDDIGNISIGEYSKIHIFDANGQLIKSFTKAKEGCPSTDFIWPGAIRMKYNKIFVQPGFCTEAYDYSGKLLWFLNNDKGSYPVIAPITSDKLIYWNYSGDPWREFRTKRSRIENGLLIYDLNGKLLEKTKSYNLLQRREQNDVIDGVSVYRGVLSKADDPDRVVFRVDKAKYLYVLRINDKPRDYENISEFAAGRVDIYDAASAKINSVILPTNKYANNRYCSGEGYTAFAGKDVVAEYGAGAEVDSHGNIYITLFMPKELKIIKWIPISFNSIMPRNVLVKLDKESLRKLRNEIYARKGRKFTSEDLASHFAKQPWYSAKADYNDNLLTQVDKDNISLLLELEKLK